MPGAPSSEDWRVLVLEGIGAPVTPDNYAALGYWAASEGMPISENNWLATTIGGFGGRVVNSAGVKAYPTIADGAAATAATIALPAYTAVQQAFDRNAGLAAIWRAVNSSPWCSGCQGGKYPVVLYDNAGTIPGPIPPVTLPPPHPGSRTAIPAETEYGWLEVQHATGRTANQQLARMNALAGRLRGLRR